MVICFHPGHLGTKPDALTRRWDVYLKGGGSIYADVNPHNYKPIFTTQQLNASLRATFLYAPVLRAVTAIDVSKLHSDILSALPKDPVSAAQLPTPLNPRYSITPTGILLLDDCIFVPHVDDLRLQVLRLKHNHPLSGHFGYNKTLELVRQDFTWPGLQTFVADYCKSCTTCKQSKTLRHKPYGTLQQLPIPERPWD